MVQTVKIRKGEKSFKVHFMYNTDLVDIMNDNNGWWYRKERCWVFPNNKFDSLYDELTKKMYKVRITRENHA